MTKQIWHIVCDNSEICWPQHEDCFGGNKLLLLH